MMKFAFDNYSTIENEKLIKYSMLSFSHGVLETFPFNLFMIFKFY